MDMTFPPDNHNVDPNNDDVITTSNVSALTQSIVGLQSFLQKTTPARSPSAKTQGKYLQNYRFRRDHDLLDPMLTLKGEAPAKRTYLFNRAALVFSARYFIERWLELFKCDLLPNSVDEIADEASRWHDLVKFVLEKAPPGERIDKPNSRSQFASTDSTPPQSTHVFKKKNSKRIGMSSLPETWRNTIATLARPRDKYADHLAILQLTGARPAEFANGVDVKRVRGALEFTLHGAKVSDTTGIENRVLQVICSTLSARRLARKLKIDGPSKTWICKEKALYAYVSALGKKAFPRHSYKISPYTYRHAFASDQKSAEVDRGQMAASMGHRSTRTSGAYGRKKTKRQVKPTNVTVVKIDGQVRQTHSQISDFGRIRGRKNAKKTVP